MPHIPEEVIEQIKNKADIIDLVSQITPVKKRGNDYWACCPFHHEKTPSFKIDPQRQNYYCFGCKKSGNVFSFVKETVNTDFIGAVRWLADRLGIVIPDSNNDDNPALASRKRLWKDNCMRLLNDVAVWFHENLRYPEAAPAVSYINSRQLDNAAVDQFMLGYSPASWDATIKWALRQGYSIEQLIATGLAVPKDNSNDVYDRFRGRLTFPICNELGRVVGFSARLLDPNPKMAKYVNSPETDFFQKSQLLYAFNFARKNFTKSGRALVCEGQLDVIACHRAGLNYAVASQGTAFTEFHAKMLKRSTNNVTMAFDADNAGQAATVRTVAILHAQGLTVDIATLPAGEDPDSIYRNGGATALQTIMGNTRPALHHLLDSFRQSHDLSIPSERSFIARELIEAIRPIPDPVTKATHLQWLAKSLDLPEQVIMQEAEIIQDKSRNDFGNSILAKQMPRKSTPDASNGYAPNTAASPVTNVSRPCPPFFMPQQNDTLFQCLLAIILCSESMANELAANQDIVSLLPDSPLGHAISIVLANTDQGEWDLAEKEISESKLAEYPPIGRVLAENDFRRLIPLEQDTAEIQQDKINKLYSAFRDCVNRITEIELNRQIAELRARLPQTPQDQQTDMQRQLMALVLQKKQLKNR